MQKDMGIMLFLTLYMHKEKEKMYTLKPFFYDAFYCIGSKCPYTCCGGWRIIADKESYERYGQYEGNIRKKILDCLVYDENGGGDTYIFRFDGRGMCPLCTEEKLCMLVKEKGEEALCPTCKMFPRESIVTNMEEHYMSLGCPAVVSFLKGRKEPLSFVIEENGGNTDGLENASAEERAAIERLLGTIEFDMAIRNSIVDLLQNREWPLWFREFMAAYCLDKIKEEHNQGKEEATYAMLEKILPPYYMEQFMQELRILPKNEMRQFELFRQIAAEFEDIIAEITFFGKEGENGTWAAELLNRHLHISFEEYKSSYDKWKLDKEEEFNLFMEHVVAYSWMEYAMMAFTKYYMLDNYWDVMLVQVLIKYFCILHYSIYDDINWEAVEFIVAFICRTVYHGRTELKEKLMRFRERNLLSMANLYLLVQP